MVEINKIMEIMVEISSQEIIVETFTSWIKVTNFAEMFVSGYFLRKKYGPTRNSNPDPCWYHKEGAEGRGNISNICIELLIH